MSQQKCFLAAFQAAITRRTSKTCIPLKGKYKLTDKSMGFRKARGASGEERFSKRKVLKKDRSLQKTNCEAVLESEPPSAPPEADL